ncbi:MULTISPECIES: M14 family metallopeptidase [Alteromonadaceae]|uniref:M14 family metallopeptidase n=1 Tax=Alteromonadaceae TaxID=72275 RepID=UPI001C0A0BD1|nr:MULTISPECIES: M14-type cytosolic carboxypeptidase [Aliiglaciecola]MBU2876266.1 succinylglutamate desuccinylase/aspartoacylase family protein [Aliiglaciecola lipolytica]MDO6710482.1 M14-type cytosolic carboxypeptidase [Aliiglaciecola sp. 2_MG-2023]MDO6751653.1 M14-type cytosolic carboxypeptidase [Aliiglaciecola sp. 1_MG-2023]
MFRILLVILAFAPVIANGCEFEELSFSANFESGRLDNCELNQSGQYVLTFMPEDKTVNPSPWYYFSVQTKVPKTVNILLTFEGYTPRYLPKVSKDQVNWNGLAFDTNEQGMLVELDVSSTPTYVAAQRPVPNDAYTTWLKSAGNKFNIQAFSLGNSSEGRAISAFVLENKDNTEWVVFIGRQHPPEVTGAVAMFSFLDEFLTTTASQKAFLSRFNVLVVPNLNPDGVANGHWRHNLGHKDLNRDWNTFSQPETKAVKTYLDKITQGGGKIVMGMDFHSTYNNVFYSIPMEENIAPTSLVIDWLAALQEKTKGVFKVVDKPGTSPGKGVFKQFIADTYKVHGVTYEVGDNEPDEKTRYVARHAANTLISTLIATAPESFYIDNCKQTNCEK